MDILDMVKEIAPVLFALGGTYAVFKWRLGRVERTVEKIAEECVTNRATCLGGVSLQISSLRDEIKSDFIQSKEDREGLKDAIHKIDVDVARLDQRVKDQNGYKNNRP